MRPSLSESYDGRTHHFWDHMNTEALDHVERLDLAALVDLLEHLKEKEKLDGLNPYEYDLVRYGTAVLNFHLRLRKGETNGR